MQLGIEAQEEKQSSCPDPVRLQPPEQMEHAGIWHVRPSDTDWNCHLNNAAYLDILWDFLPDGIAAENLGLISVCFLSQALAGDEISVYRKVQENELLFRGVHERGTCFEAKIALK